LAADTIVCHAELGMLGKPVDHADAVRMLQALCNTEHKVVTGVALIDLATERRVTLADVTTVHFGAYGLEEIEDYLSSEPPFDKAGSYAIQGMWGKQVLKIEGDLENVIGLPYYRLNALLSNSAQSLQQLLL
ncbi:MAG: Maf family protein, partial [Coriobacteriia bacterium]|nr:Maf family protein [Coriobacteriia bacterium]